MGVYIDALAAIDGNENLLDPGLIILAANDVVGAMGGFPKHHTAEVRLRLVLAEECVGVLRGQVIACIVRGCG